MPKDTVITFKIDGKLKKFQNSYNIFSNPIKIPLPLQDFGKMT